MAKEPRQEDFFRAPQNRRQGRPMILFLGYSYNTRCQGRTGVPKSHCVTRFALFPTSEQRVMAVHGCLESALKARGMTRVPRLRRVARVVKRYEGALPHRWRPRARPPCATPPSAGLGPVRRSHAAECRALHSGPRRVFRGPGPELRLHQDLARPKPDRPAWHCSSSCRRSLPLRHAQARGGVADPGRCQVRVSRCPTTSVVNSSSPKKPSSIAHKTGPT